MAASDGGLRAPGPLGRRGRRGRVRPRVVADGEVRCAIARVSAGRLRREGRTGRETRCRRSRTGPCSTATCCAARGTARRSRCVGGGFDGSEALVRDLLVLQVHAGEVGGSRCRVRRRAVHGFMSGFGMPAYASGSVPDSAAYLRRVRPRGRGRSERPARRRCAYGSRRARRRRRTRRSRRSRGGSRGAA